MASKVIVIACLCLALVSFVQSAPQYTPGEVPEYDDDDAADEPVEAHSSSNKDETLDGFDLSLLDQPYANARDPGRRPEFLKNLDSETQPDSSSSSSDSTGN